MSLATRMPSISTKCFLYNAESRSFFAECSDLPGRFPGERFSLISSRTGREVEVRFEAEEIDRRENEVLGWRYFIPDLMASLFIAND